MITSIISAVVAMLSGVVGAVLAYMGTSGKTRSDSLDRAATWWETAVKEIKAENVEYGRRISALEESNGKLLEENHMFRDALREVMAWLVVNIRHEQEGNKPPPPYPFRTILSRIEKVLRAPQSGGAHSFEEEK